ncbi:MAG TPA: hypothetical protein VHO70_08785, partial [Chitinispirillaceae bacterium]|nr:hypothetical protein [Chitinispirillaceae bacterium]
MPETHIPPSREVKSKGDYNEFCNYLIKITTLLKSLYLLRGGFKWHRQASQYCSFKTEKGGEYNEVFYMYRS